MLNKNVFLALLRIATSYAGAVIGAGFASGQEIMQFFVSYGARGIAGAAFSTLLFAYTGGLVMYLAAATGSRNYLSLYEKIMGKLGRCIMDFLSLAMLLGGLFVMTAGGAAVFKEKFGLPELIGSLSITLAVASVLAGGLEGVLTANMIFVPVKLLAVTVISLCSLSSAGWVIPAAAGNTVMRPGGHWLLSAFLYVSYNMVAPAAVLSSLGCTIPVKVAVAGGFLGGLIIGGAVLLETLALLANMPSAASYQVPLLFLAEGLGVGPGFLAGLLIWMAVFTSAVADAHGFASRLSPFIGMRYRLFGIGACFLSIPVAGLGFSFLVGHLYPLFGYAGAVLLGSLILFPLFPSRFPARKFR